MITINTRHLDVPWTVPQTAQKIGCLKAIVRVGVSMIGGWLVGAVLVGILHLFNVDLITARWVGGSVGFMLTLLWLYRWGFTDKIEYPEGYGEAIDEVRIENIIKALPVYELEDFGPGFLVETKEGEQIYFSGQILEDEVYSGDDDEVEEVLSETVIFEADHASHSLLKFSLSGTKIAVETVGVDCLDLPIENYLIGYAVLPTKAK